jgi:hypothetical protein
MSQDDAVAMLNAMKPQPPSGPKPTRPSFKGPEGVGQGKGAKKHMFQGKVKFTADEEQGLRRVFDIFDTDKSASIDNRELGALFSKLGLPCKRDEVQATIEEFDDDGSGEIEFNEFLEMMAVTRFKQQVRGCAGSAQSHPRTCF